MGQDHSASGNTRDLNRARHHLLDAEKDYVSALFRPTDTNFNGRLDADEIVRLLPNLHDVAKTMLDEARGSRQFELFDGENSIAMGEPASFLMDNRTVLSAEDFIKAVQHRFPDLTLDQVRSALHQSFPQNIADVTLADIAAQNSDLGCLPLPNTTSREHPLGQLAVFNTAPERT